MFLSTCAPVCAQPATVVNTLPSLPMRGTAGTPADGITVTASGYADAPADSASVSMYLDTARATITPETLVPIVDALVATGVERTAIQTTFDVTGQTGPSTNVALMARIDHPTAQKVRDALPAVAGAFAKQPDLHVGNALVRLSYDACNALIETARANAIAAARKRADEIAKTLGVAVGSVRAFSDVEPPVDYRGRCTSTYTIPSGSQGPQSPEDMVTVRVTAHVTVRYAIR